MTDGLRRVGVLALAGLGGYLAGSVSFSGLIARWRAPGQDLSVTEYPVEGTGRTVTVRAMSPMAIGEHLGGRWAALAVALEALKAAIPTAIARAAAPGSSAAVVAAASAVLGHAYPVGRGPDQAGGGESPMLGGFLVLDPVGFLVTTGASGVVIGATRDRRLIMAWPLTLVAWAALRRDRALLVYALGANTVLWTRLARSLDGEVAPAFTGRSRRGGGTSTHRPQ